MELECLGPECTNSECRNHDPHQAAAVSEGFCPSGHGPLTPWEHSCSRELRSPKQWGYCEPCGTSYRSLPNRMAGRIFCSPDGYCAQEEFRKRWETLPSYRQPFGYASCTVLAHIPPEASTA